MACATIGLDDPRTVALIRPSAQERGVRGPLLQRLATSVDGERLHQFVGQIGRTVEDIVQVAEQWASATKPPFDQKIAEMTMAALGEPGVSTPGET